MPRGRKVRNTNSAAVWRTNARAPFFFWVDAFFFSAGAFHFFLFFLWRDFLWREITSAGSGRGGRVFSLDMRREKVRCRVGAIDDSLFSRREGQFASQSKKRNARLIFWKKKKSLSRSRSTRVVRRREREEKKPIDGWRFSSSSRLSSRLSLSRDAKRTRSGIFVE